MDDLESKVAEKLAPAIEIALRERKRGLGRVA
jgi:hypothetical protein